MPFSNYPNGFTGGVNIRGLPVLNTYAGNVFWVDSGAGSNGNRGTFDRPFSTIDYAVGRCTANNGDLIMVKPGHAETITAAGGIACDVAGVQVVGLGDGSDRPTITFATSTAASIVVSAANVSFRNLVLICNIDGATNPLHIQAADCVVDACEFRDTSSAVEAARVILTTAAADRLVVRGLKYRGQTGGDACVNAIRLVGCDGADIDIDFYGKASTAVVEFLTTACTSVNVRGTMYVSGTTDGSKNVVDTATGSTWYMDVVDAAAGARYTGGSAAAVASDDVSSLSAVVGTADLTTTDSLHGKIGTDTEMADRSVYDLVNGGGPATAATAAAPGNNASLYAVLRDVWDAVRNGTGGAEPGTNKSLIDAIGFDGAAAVSASAGMLRTATGTTFVVSKTLAASAIVAAGADLTAASTVGNILIEDVVIQNAGTQMDSAGNGAVLEIYTNNIAGSGSFVTDAEAKLLANVVLSGATHTTNNKVVLETGKKVIVKATTEDFTSAGNVTFHILCRRLADNATLTAA